MNDNILKKLAAKLAESEPATDVADPVVEVPEEHFDLINAAMNHRSSHYNNHVSSV